MRSTTLTISLGLQGLANDLEKRLVQMTGERQHFILVIMSGNLVQNVSNTRVEDRITVLRELLARWERGEPDVPAHTNLEIK